MTVMFWPVVVFMAISLAIGLYTYTQVRGSSKRFTVCGKTMPFIVIGTALMAQAVDGNATLGNSSLTYSGGFWAGAMIPIGLAISLFIVGRFLAAPLNQMNLLTLPEFFYRRYGQGVELMVSILTTVCFTIVIAGNLAAVGYILSSASGLSYATAMMIGAVVILLYTMAGGLYAAIWTDFLQIHVALVGFVGAAIWLLVHHGWGNLMGAIPPEKLDLSGITSMPGGALLNWASMFSLAFGNAMALDFMERVFAARTPGTARNACYYAGVMTLVIGMCASIMGLASITLLPQSADSRMVLPVLASTAVPYWLGMMVFLGIMGASMSTANGAMLVISVVLARNVVQRWTRKVVADSTMLMLSRLFAIPTAAAAAWIAYVRPEPGVLLVVAFDIVLAGCVVPLFLGVYWKKANTAGAYASILVGTLSRIACFYLVPASLAGLDTLLPPVLSGIAFLIVCPLAASPEPELMRQRLYTPVAEDLLLVETEG